MNNNKMNKNLLSEVWFSLSLQRENIELAICVKTPQVLIAVYLPPLPPHTVNLLCYVHYRLI